MRPNDHNNVLSVSRQWGRDDHNNVLSVSRQWGRDDHNNVLSVSRHWCRDDHNNVLSVSRQWGRDDHNNVLSVSRQWGRDYHLSVRKHSHFQTPLENPSIQTHLVLLCCIKCLCIFGPKGAIQISYYFYFSYYYCYCWVVTHEWMNELHLPVSDVVNDNSNWL